MSQPFVGQIMMFAGNFPPAGWAFCNGQLMSIADNETLFNLIGTTYGGDGQTTFALPDLRSRVPMHQSPSFPLAQQGGVETVTLTTSQIPSHSHVPACNSGSGNSSDPTNDVWAGNSNTAAPQFTAGANANANMNGGVMGSTGGSQPHDNMIPFLAINFCISLFGIFPSQN